MEASKICLFVLGLILAIAVQSGLCIKCYECNSGKKYDGEVCSNTKKLTQNQDLLVDCEKVVTLDPSKNGTMKLCRIFTQDVMGESRIIRQCASDGRTDKCIDRTGTKDIKLNYCHCDQDGCNSASSLYAPITMVITVLASIWTIMQHS